MTKRSQYIKKPNILDRIIGYFMPRYAEKQIQAQHNLINQQCQLLNIPTRRRIISEGMQLPEIKNINCDYDNLIDSTERAHNSVTTVPIDPDQFPS